jgi:multiple sugar transport system permease protein
MKSVRKHISKILKMIVLITGAIVMATPFIWMILTAFKTNSETTSLNPFVIFPSGWRFDAFTLAIHDLNFGVLYFNTIALIAGRVSCAVLTAAMAGYALGRLNFFGRRICFTVVLIQMMIPAQIFIIPQYLMINRLGALNTLFALIFPGLVTAFGTFLLRQNFMTLPSSLEEAARIDGANIGQIFLFVMFPLVRSGMVALGIFTSLFAYKDLMWPLIVNTATDAMPLSSALAKLQGQFSNTNYPKLMAASLLASLLMIIIYLIFQKQFIQGIAASGGKL